jgi:hypothetical protein
MFGPRVWLWRWSTPRPAAGRTRKDSGARFYDAAGTVGTAQIGPKPMVP